MSRAPLTIPPGFISDWLATIIGLEHHIGSSTCGHSLGEIEFFEN